MKEVTLCFLLKENQVCLAMKKRGFGEGKWNGVGGKVDENETVIEAAKREAKEEILVDVEKITKHAVLEFFPMNLRCHVFLTESWEGEPAETEEMKPHWFHLDKLPFEDMWQDDIYWLKRIIEGEKLIGEFHFDGNDNLLRHRLEVVENL